ncbi:hypothetical protein SGPA1_60285 [Streptomyces misionensis JCM 4497]
MQGAGDVLGAADPAHRGGGGDVLEDGLALFGRLVVPPGGVDDARGDRVDPQRGQFDGERRDHRLQGAVDRGEAGGARDGGAGGGGGHQGDRAVPAQRGQRGLEHLDLRPELAVETGRQVREVQLGEGSGALAAAEGDDQVVDGAGPGEEGVQRGPVRGVQPVARDLSALACEPRHRGVEPVLAATGDDHLRAVRRAERGGRLADARAAAHDDDTLSGEGVRKGVRSAHEWLLSRGVTGFRPVAENVGLAKRCRDR